MTISFTSRINAVIDGAIAAERIVGAVVLVVRDGETLHARAAGFADREAGISMRADAIFRLASVSKLFTATAVMALVAEGRLDLDRSITDWLPAFTPTFDDRTAVITLRHDDPARASTGSGYGTACRLPGVGSSQVPADMTGRRCDKAAPADRASPFVAQHGHRSRAIRRRGVSGA